jgi:hypothetical protein
MSMLGKAALAMWWDVPQGVRGEWEHWHTHEHFPERLSIPGFLRASRWTDAADGGGFFVVYELADHAVLASAPYVARLNAPTPWSTKMMPLHLNMVRTQCQVVESHGAVAAKHALTVRCSPAEGQTNGFRQSLKTVCNSLVHRPGIVGMHVLRHQPPQMAPTTEQKIRGHTDRAADWVIFVAGHNLDALRQVGEVELSKTRLRELGAVEDTAGQLFTLAITAIPSDMR